MKRQLFHCIAIILVGTLLEVNAWLPFQMMGHAKTHAHHQATTHATPLCTLLCSAGQMAQMAAPTPAVVLSDLFALESPLPNSYRPIQASRLLARGPPTLLQLLLQF